jgi:hypothetical protein
VLKGFKTRTPENWPSPDGKITEDNTKKKKNGKGLKEHAWGRSCRTCKNRHTPFVKQFLNGRPKY